MLDYQGLSKKEDYEEKTPSISTKKAASPIQRNNYLSYMSNVNIEISGSVATKHMAFSSCIFYPIPNFVFAFRLHYLQD